ncbi:MAG: tRNA guanosine(15) transglycosylase TgtA [Candidatus Bathyarchaeia archaeon]
MSLGFTVKAKDLMGRIGVIRTKSGSLETPHMFPVLDPKLKGIRPRFIREVMRCNGVMTNAYLLWRYLAREGDGVKPPLIHEYLDFDGIVATDSGAYQILLYGEVEVKPDEIIRFQNEISTDIGVILDVPTGLVHNRLEAEYTVKETLRRADESLKLMDPEILWIGPIQGGLFKDLLTLSAREMALKPFQMYGLGSPTQIMERYLFDKLVDMVVHVKGLIPGDKPLHLFGAGHPMTFPLIVACGVDTFDSAAYAIYAKDERYMTAEGSLKLSRIEYFPCSCRQCVKYTPSELRGLDPDERREIIAEHNLWVCLQEIKRIKEAISEGRLWELVHARSMSHPALHRAFRGMRKYSKLMERSSPVAKRRGLSIFTYMDYHRPEVVRHVDRLLSRCTGSEGSSTLVMLPHPIHLGGSDFPEELIRVKNGLRDTPGIWILYYGHPYGVIPVELEDVYPLGQTEVSVPVDGESREFISKIIKRFLRRHLRGAHPSRILVILEPSLVSGSLIEDLKAEACSRGCKISFEGLSARSLRSLKSMVKEGSESAH